MIEVRKTEVFAHWLDGLLDVRARAIPRSHALAVQGNAPRAVSLTFPCRSSRVDEPVSTLVDSHSVYIDVSTPLQGKGM